MEEGAITAGRKKARGGRQINPENVWRTAELIAENPNITIREAAQHLNVPETVAKKIMRKEHNVFPFKHQVNLKAFKQKLNCLKLNIFNNLGTPKDQSTGVT